MNWTEERIGKFTASEIWKLFVEPRSKKETVSETTKTYILEKAVEELTGFRKQITNKAMEHGIINEAEAFEQFKHLTKQDWQYTSKQFFSIDEFSGASPDGVLYHDMDVIAVCDIKCPQPLTFFEIKLDADGPVENKYFYQLQMQMMATKCEIGYLVYYLAPEFVDTYTGEVDYKFDLPLEQRIIIKTIEKDETVCNIIKEKIQIANDLKQTYLKSLS